MFLRNHFLSILWSAIILILTLIPGNNLPEVNIYSFDKLVHFAIFGLLMILVLRDLKRSNIIKSYVLFSFVFCISFGSLIELVQNLVPGRSCSLYDAIANTIGVVLGYFIFKMVKNKL